MQGRRRPDGTPPYQLQRGEYAKTIVTNGDETEEWDEWGVCAPDGGTFLLCNEHNRDHHGRYHEVEEHEDGSISVVPRPDNTNSILSPGGWHGWIRRGRWDSVAT